MIRKAIMEDIKDIMEIIRQTIAEMRTYNNTQWDENYPQKKDFIDDIENENLFIVERNEILVGFLCINKIEPAEYNGLNWSLNEDCLVLHRMSVSPNHRRCGIASELMKFTESLALKNNIQYLKTDTYSVNAKMQALFKKCGYNFVGEIHFNGKEKPFYCYEKILSK
ncbi:MULTISPECIES: GNAT family N-acetyltransferase [Clostridium]|uniref:Acetyltransferase (GNAT) family protein n=2 Tax=Clostridium TaxID=1485 RepID=D8GUP9_CLOLD|nr:MULTISPECIES: GNAT family N-acetyltransferase [Clostridium]ADK16926.1 putative acetyltransferase [Clostridium ljungdahlii DSM 13528]OAA85302.1 Acetyltransferase (GNAT) family protein [Clostridium ljungdahlii DSM 13528]OAA90866.1 Acetyltransferase (GNAT) family protein [Clostridium coskatii]OBR96900.1 acetyltransferase (GNAT) family protein [Clostridium coskatii]